MKVKMTTDYLKQARDLGLDQSASWKRFCKNFESIVGSEPTFSGMGLKLRKSQKTDAAASSKSGSDIKNPFLKAKAKELLPKLISENARLSARLLCMEGIVPAASEDNASNIIAAQAGDSRRIESVSEFKALLGYLGDFEAAADAEAKSAELKEIFSQVSMLPKITPRAEFAKEACLAAPLVLRDLAKLGNGSQGWIVASTIVAKGIMRAAGARTLDADPFEGRCAKKFAAFEAALGTAAASDDGIKDLADHLFTAVNAGFADACAAVSGKKTASGQSRASATKSEKIRNILKWVGFGAFAWTAALLLIGLFGDHGVFWSLDANGSSERDLAYHSASMAIGFMRLFVGKTSLMMPLLSVLLAIWAIKHIPKAIQNRKVSEQAALAEMKGARLLMGLLGTIAGCSYSPSGAVAAGICFFCYASFNGYLKLAQTTLRPLKNSTPESVMCMTYLLTVFFGLIIRMYLSSVGSPLFAF